MSSHPTSIVAIGTANPPYYQFQQETVELIATSLKLQSTQSRLLRSIYRASGIEKRYSVLSDYCKPSGQLDFFPNDEKTPYPGTGARMKVYQEHALDLAINAIKNALLSLDSFDLQQVTHLITVSCTGMYAPGIDIEIVFELGLSPKVKRTAVNFMGCYGAFNALKIGDAICQADRGATVLIVCVELCTIHFQKSMQIDNMISNSIFADGAGAVLLKAEGLNKKCFTLENFHNDLLPQTKKEMAWHIGDHGFDIVLSTYVPKMIESGIEMFTRNLFNQSKIGLEDIDFFAIHPGGVKILEACEKILNISKEDNKYSYEVLKNYGNMSSATILFVLKALWNGMGVEDNQKNIFSCAFGPGLTLESLLLKVHC